MAAPVRLLVRACSFYSTTPRRIPRNINLKKKQTQIMDELSLRPVKKIQSAFDPFAENVRSIREFVFLSSIVKLRTTNPKCIFKNDVRSDRHEPTIDVTFNDGAYVIFKTCNLTTTEILEKLLELCNNKDPDKASKEVTVKKKFVETHYLYNKHRKKTYN